MPTRSMVKTLLVGVHHVSQERAVAGSATPSTTVCVDSEDEYV